MFDKIFDGNQRHELFPLWAVLLIGAVRLFDTREAAGKSSWK
jgi:hypothetical protein